MGARVAVAVRRQGKCHSIHQSQNNTDLNVVRDRSCSLYVTIEVSCPSSMFQIDSQMERAKISPTLATSCKDKPTWFVTFLSKWKFLLADFSVSVYALF